MHSNLPFLFGFDRMLCVHKQSAICRTKQINIWTTSVYRTSQTVLVPTPNSRLLFIDKRYIANGVSQIYDYSRHSATSKPEKIDCSCLLLVPLHSRFIERLEPWPWPYANRTGPLRTNSLFHHPLWAQAFAASWSFDHCHQHRCHPLRSNCPFLEINQQN